MRKVKFNLRPCGKRLKRRPEYGSTGPLCYQRDGECHSWREYTGAAARLRTRFREAMCTRIPQQYDRYTEKFFKARPGN